MPLRFFTTSALSLQLRCSTREFILQEKGLTVTSLCGLWQVALDFYSLRRPITNFDQCDSSACVAQVASPLQVKYADGEMERLGKHTLTLHTHSK